MSDLERVTQLAEECGLAVSSDGKDFLCNYKQLLAFEQAVLAKRDEDFKRDMQFKVAEIAELRSKKFARFNNEDCWIFQDDADDHLESLVCPVVVTPQYLLSVKAEIESLQAKLARLVETGNTVIEGLGNQYHVNGGDDYYQITHEIVAPFGEALDAVHDADVDAFMAKKKAELEKDVLEELRTRYQLAEGRLSLDLFCND